MHAELRNALGDYRDNTIATGEMTHGKDGGQKNSLLTIFRVGHSEVQSAD